MLVRDRYPAMPPGPERRSSLGADVASLAFPHRLVVAGYQQPHWHEVAVRATAPLSQGGITAFIRYEDEVATRYGYVVSRWWTEEAYGPYAGVMVYSVDAAASGAPPRDHPSNDGRFRVVLIEAEAWAEGAGRPVPPAPPQPTLWARRGPDDVLVPVTVSSGSDGAVIVRIQGAGLLPQDATLLLGDVHLGEQLTTSPVPVPAAVYPYTVRTREKVAARVAAGRARAEATLTIGTLEQFEESTRLTGPAA